MVVKVIFKSLETSTILNIKRCYMNRFHFYLLLNFFVILSSGNFGAEHEIVTEKDLDHLIQLLNGKISDDVAWQNQMERTTSNMLYQAWRYEPEVHYINLVPLRFLYIIISYISTEW